MFNYICCSSINMQIKDYLLYTKNINNKDLLDLANFIITKGFFEKTFSASDALASRNGSTSRKGMR